MNLTQWFENQLQASADGFVWATEQVPHAQHYAQPPDGLGEWTVVRHVFHLAYYEQTLALPSMRQWIGEASPSSDDLEELTWERTTNHDMESLLGEFSKVRQQQIELLAQFDDRLWRSMQETIWGPTTLLWVVSKTYQHTAEHTSDVMRIGLFWDRFAERMKKLPKN